MTSLLSSIQSLSPIETSMPVFGTRGDAIFALNGAGGRGAFLVLSPTTQDDREQQGDILRAAL
jgi:hypothetical protein